LRVTGGELKGRKIQVPATGTRPALDRVREAVFSSLGDCVNGVRVLDLFAGSGAYGLEAWSRGADTMCWVEQDANAVRVLRGNVKALCDGESGDCRIVRADVWTWIARAGSLKIDLIFADPPYSRGDTEGQTEKLMQAIASTNMLRDGGLLVYEQGKKESVPEPEGWMLLRNRSYGRTRSLIYRKEETI